MCITYYTGRASVTNRRASVIYAIWNFYTLGKSCKDFLRLFGIIRTVISTEAVLLIFSCYLHFVVSLYAYAHFSRVSAIICKHKFLHHSCAVPLSEPLLSSCGVSPAKGGAVPLQFQRWFWNCILHSSANISFVSLMAIVDFGISMHIVFCTSLNPGKLQRAVVASNSELTSSDPKETTNLK